MKPEKVLIIEDDATLRRVLEDAFGANGYEVKSAADGQTGLARALELDPDLVILDVMLPHLSGHDVCRRLRTAGRGMLILMLTARDEESDLLHGLDIGADDYITKPFSIDELLTRAHAFLRRSRGFQTASFRFGSFLLGVPSRKLYRDGREIELTPREFRVLEYLNRHAGRALTRDELLHAAWPSVIVTPRSVDRCITTLRAKIEDDPRHPRWIRTVRDVGYRFEAEPQDQGG